MELVKPAAATCLGHSTATITDTSQQLPDVDDAFSAGARMVLIQNCDSLGASVWVTCDASDAEVDHGIKLESLHRLELTLDDVRKTRVIAPSSESCKLSVSYFR